MLQATNDATNAYKEATSSIDNYASRYTELREALLAARGNEEETYKIKKQLLELQTELNDKYGEEYGHLNLVTNAYKDQTDAILSLNKELARSYLNENEKGIQKATDVMESENHYNLTYPGVSAYTDEGKLLKETAEKYKDLGVYLNDEFVDGSYDKFSIHLKADPQTAYDTINAFASELREKAIELGNEDLFADALEISSASLNQAKSKIDTYGETYRQALISQIAIDDNLSAGYNQAVKAVETYNEAMLKSNSPFGDEAVAKAYQDLQAVKEEMAANGTDWEKYSCIMEDIFASANDGLYSFYQSIESNACYLGKPRTLPPAGNKSFMGWGNAAVN